MTEKIKTVQVSKCPICGNPADSKYKPFCSARCADVDLNRWLSGVYKVPTNEEPSPEDFADVTSTACQDSD